MPRPGRYPRHRRLPLRQQVQFAGLFFLSTAAVFVIALLSRAELRLSGETLAADGSELKVLEELQPFEHVELIREEPELRLYLLRRGAQKFLAHVVKQGDGSWDVERVERVHR